MLIYITNTRFFLQISSNYSYMTNPTCQMQLCISGGSELQSSRQCETTHQGGIDGAIAAVSPSRRSSDLPVLLDIQYCSTVPTLRQNHFGLTIMHKYEYNI